MKKTTHQEKVKLQTHIERSNRHSDILNHSPFTLAGCTASPQIHPIPFIPLGHMLMYLFRYSSLVRLTCRLLVIAFKWGKNRLNIWVLRARAYISVTDGLTGNRQIRWKRGKNHWQPASGGEIKKKYNIHKEENVL